MINGDKFHLDVHLENTVLLLKEKIQEYTGIYKEQQRLIFQGSPLCDDYTIEKYNIKDENVIHLLVQMKHE